MTLGPGIPQLLASRLAPRQAHRHLLREHQRVQSRPILNGLHHEYRLARRAAYLQGERPTCKESGLMVYSMLTLTASGRDTKEPGRTR